MRASAGQSSGESPALPPLGTLLEFMRLVWTIDRGFGSASRRIALPRGITVPQHLVMRVVGRLPGISAGQLARILHAHPSTLTGVLRQLERRGLLSRRADPRDGRRAALGLTEKGWRLDAAAGGAVEEAVHRALGGLPAREVRAAVRVLHVLAGVLEGREVDPWRHGTGTGARRARRPL